MKRAFTFFTSILVILLCIWGGCISFPYQKKPLTVALPLARITHMPTSSLTKRIPDRENRLIPILRDTYLPAFAGLTSSKAHHANPNNTTPVLTPYAARHIFIEEILGHSQYAQVDTTVLNNQTRQDLKLFADNPTDLPNSLLAKLNSSATWLGEVVMASMLAAPPTNIGVMEMRQAAIKTLLDAHETSRKLTNELHKLQKSLPGLFSLYSADDLLYGEDKTTYFTNWFYGTISAMHAMPWYIAFRKLCWVNLQDIGVPLVNGLSYLLAVGLPTFRRLIPEVTYIEEDYEDMITNKDALYNQFYNGFCELLKMFKGITSIELPLVLNHLLKKNGKEVIKNYLVPSCNITAYQKELKYFYHQFFWLELTIVVTAGSYLWQAYKRYKYHQKQLRYLQHRLKDLQALVLFMQHVQTMLQSDPALRAIWHKHFPCSQTLLTTPQDTSLGKLIAWLQTVDLDKNFFQETGKQFAILTLWQQHKYDFVDALYELGQLDVLLGIADLMRDVQKTPNQYTFVTLTQDKKPIIDFKDMWHPLVGADCAVPNHVSLGRDTKHLIVTGSNQSGKSTLLTGISTNLLMAHVWGIVAAKDATLTPFRHIFANINMRDDLHRDKSLFRMETDNWKALLTTFAALPKDAFSFLVTDEILNGTNTLDAISLSKTILKKMSKYPNVVGVTSTHFFELTALAAEIPNHFTNIKAVIDWDAHKTRKNYTYRFVPGKATLEEASVLTEVLQSSHFNTAFIEAANEEKKKLAYKKRA